MRIFGFDISRGARPAEQKASAVGASLVMTPGRAVWSNRDYASFSKEAYQQNVVANRCIASIAEAVASVPLTVCRGETELVTSPIGDLLAQPNPAQGYSEYVTAVVGYLLISGNSYQEAVTATGAQVQELYSLRPDRMKIVPGADGMPQAYEYCVNGSRVIFDAYGEPAAIKHTRLFNPLNDWYGLAPVEAGAYAIDIHNAAMEYTQAYLGNSARPSGALVTKEKSDLSDEAFERLKAQLEDQHQGPRNAGRPMLLEGGLAWQAMGGSPKDAMLTEVKNSAARDICLAFGVPPMLIGIPGDNTYSNYSEARLAFWEDTVIPTLGLIVGEWNEWLAEPQGMEIKPDLDAIPAIVEKRQRLWDMVEKSSVLTINEKREAMGYDTIEGGEAMPMDTDPLAGLGPDEFNALAYGLDLETKGGRNG
ncbi:MAG: phage portal protein [Epibacterium sp.]|nr:phage portal protein [Epibacterium sp.]NQX73921.1 phage portal protein [Epibacterium sp.]